MKITVTKEDIAQGKTCNPHSCPCALALLRALALGTDAVTVRPDYISVYRFSPRAKQIPTPPAVLEFIDNFDAGRVVQPMEFEIDL